MTDRAFFAWFAIGHLANDWPIAALWIIIPVAGVSLGLSPAEVGLLFTIFNIGGALAYIPAGIVSDHVSNQGRLLVATFGWVVVGYSLAALAEDVWVLALLLAIAGMGNAAWHPIAASVLTRRSGGRRAYALGIHAIGGSAAEIMAPFGAGLLLSAFDWRSALAMSAVPALVMGVCFLVVTRRVPSIEARPIQRQDLRELMTSWRSASGLEIIAMVCSYNMAQIALLSMIPLYLVETRQVSVASAGLIFSILMVSGALAQPWVGSMSDRIGRKPVIAAGSTCAGLAATILVLSPSFLVMLTAMAIAIASLDAIRSVVLAAAVDHAEEHEGKTLGLAFTLMDGVGALGALAAGVTAGFSWPHMFAMVGALALVTACLALRTG